MAEEESLKAEMSALLRGDIERARERREQPPVAADAEPEPQTVPEPEPQTVPEPEARTVSEPEPEPAPEPRRGFRRFFGQA